MANLGQHKVRSPALTKPSATSTFPLQQTHGVHSLKGLSHHLSLQLLSYIAPLEGVTLRSLCRQYNDSKLTAPASAWKALIARDVRIYLRGNPKFLKCPWTLAPWRDHSSASAQELECHFKQSLPRGVVGRMFRFYTTRGLRPVFYDGSMTVRRLSDSASDWTNKWEHDESGPVYISRRRFF